MCPQTAIITARRDRAPIATDEITRLASAAGYEIRATVTQQRAPDPRTNLGAGAVERVAERAAEVGAETVIVDNDLTPEQSHRIGRACPDGTAVRDRVRLVLDLFGEQASSRAATLQAERARLRYELPRVRAAISRDVGNERLRAHAEEGKPIAERQRRIEEIDDDLAAMREAADERRERRRAEGFDLVALAGYTNAGKSTLLRRLADDLSVPSDDADSPDVEATATVADRLCETLETTTRRATLDGRRTLLTDTVGFVADVPPAVTASFQSTLGAVASADLVALVVDGSEPPEALSRKVDTALSALDDAEAILPVCNKADRLDAGERADRLALLSDLGAPPVAVSARTGENVGALVDRLTGTLPEQTRATLCLPNTDEGMSLLSWLYDHGRVLDVTYREEDVTVAFAASEAIVERAQSRASVATD